MCGVESQIFTTSIQVPTIPATRRSLCIFSHHVWRTRSFEITIDMLKNDGYSKILKYVLDQSIERLAFNKRGKKCKAMRMKLSRGEFHHAGA